MTTATPSTNLDTERAVLDAVKHSEGGMTLTQLCARLVLPRALLRSTLSSIVLSGRLQGTGSAGSMRYRLPAQVACYAANPRTVTSTNDADPYLCPELDRNPGIPDSRYAAYDLPRREGERLYWPGGRVTRLCGAPL